MALTAATAAQEDHAALIFDEVDNGVGGRLGRAIGEKLVILGSGRSVVAITHTPQVAALAQRQYVRKEHDTSSTAVIVEELAAEARVSELADMLGGGKAAVKQAEALLKEGCLNVK